MHLQCECRAFYAFRFASIGGWMGGMKILRRYHCSSLMEPRISFNALNVTVMETSYEVDTRKLTGGYFQITLVYLIEDTIAETIL